MLIIYNSSDLGFETSAREGAILIILIVQQLRYPFNAKAHTHEHWYKYNTTDKRGRPVENGDIRIVVGCDKVSSWGIATLASSLRSSPSSL